MEGTMRIVEALDEGKIVRVSEEYAVREGLPILRRPTSFFESMKEEKKEKKIPEVFHLDRFRRQLKNKNDVLASLIDNFHWHFSSARRASNLTRKQLAEKIGSSEHDLKMLENGALPHDDYVLISKLEKFFGINVRKEGQNVLAPTREMLDASRAGSLSEPLRKKEMQGEHPRVRDYRARLIAKEREQQKASAENVFGSDIEILNGE